MKSVAVPPSIALYKSKSKEEWDQEIRFQDVLITWQIENFKAHFHLH